MEEVKKAYVAGLLEATSRFDVLQCKFWDKGTIKVRVRLWVKSPFKHILEDLTSYYPTNIREHKEYGIIKFRAVYSALKLNKIIEDTFPYLTFRKYQASVVKELKEAQARKGKFSNWQRRVILANKIKKFRHINASNYPNCKLNTINLLIPNEINKSFIKGYLKGKNWLGQPIETKHFENVKYIESFYGGEIKVYNKVFIYLPSEKLKKEFLS